MKLLTILLASIGALEMAFTALASDYKDFAAEGYRWVKIDGPFMCPTKEDLREITWFRADTSAEMGAVPGATETATHFLRTAAGGFRNPE